MPKKLILVATALVAVAAMAIPSIASAGLLTMPAKTLVTVGTEITGTSGKTFANPLMTETGLGALNCESIMLNGKVTINNATNNEAEGQNVAGSTTSGCTLGGKAATVSEINLINLKSNVGKNGKNTFEASYAAKIPGGAECKFTNKGSPGTFTYVTGTDIITIAKSVVNSAACGESELTGEVTLETTPAAGGGPVLLS